MGHSIETGWLLTQVPRRKRDVLDVWDKLFKEYSVASEKCLARVELVRKYGLKCSSTATFYNKLNAWKDKGILGLAPKRFLERASEEATTYPRGFIPWWLVLCGESQRKTAPAWRTLIDTWLEGGKVIPGYEKDWRGIYIDEHPGWAIPERCPYSRKANVFPKGWSQRHLSRKAMDAYQRVAVRIGTAAAKEFLPSIPTTRFGLPFCRVFVIDDMEHDGKFSFQGNMNAQGAVELGALELLTGNYCAWGVKPIIERRDKNGITREKLREDYNRYLIAQILCGIGFSSDGCLIAGEHGTAKIPADLLATLNRLTGNLIEFKAGGILNTPIAKGLYMGARRGNFRWKAALESLHNLKKNELAQLPGQKGADPEHAPEHLASQMQFHRWVQKAALVLFEDRPDLYEALDTGFPLYSKFAEFLLLFYGRINNRYDHNLEGWDALGFMRPEWRMTKDDVWKPWSELSKLNPGQREAIESVIDSNRDLCFRNRNMSPAEAFQHCRTVYAGNIHRLPEWCVPEILGAGLADRLEVKQNGTIMVPDKYIPNQVTQVGGIVKDKDGQKHLIERGREVLVWLSPVDSNNAYIATRDGVYLGVAPVMHPGTKIDAHAFHRNMTVVNEIVKQELEPLQEIAEKRLRELNATREKTIKALTGKTSAELIERRLQEKLDAGLVNDALLEMAGMK